MYIKVTYCNKNATKNNRKSYQFVSDSFTQQSLPNCFIIPPKSTYVVSCGTSISSATCHLPQCNRNLC